MVLSAAPPSQLLGVWGHAGGGGAELTNTLLALSAGEEALCAGRTGPWGDRRQLKAHLSMWPCCWAEVDGELALTLRPPVLWSVGI